MEKGIKCTLCRRIIAGYDPAFNHFKIDAWHDADICLDCIDKFEKWRQDIYARLFPTGLMKKWRAKKRGAPDPGAPPESTSGLRPL